MWFCTAPFLSETGCCAWYPGDEVITLLLFWLNPLLRHEIVCVSDIYYMVSMC